MTNTEMSAQAIRLNKRLLVVGAVLVGVGGTVAAAGVLFGTAAVVSATRQWVKQLDTPPSEMARQRLHQARIAASAAAEALRKDAVSKPAGV
jgi:hypothetical protein